MNILRAITLLAFENPTDADTIGIYVYFGAASFILLICVWLHYVFIKSEIYFYYTMAVRRKTIEYSEVTDNSGGVPLVPKAKAPEEDMNFKTMGIVFKKVWLYVILLIFLYIQTFMFFPGVMLDKPISTSLMDTDWKIVWMIGTYNVFDTIGKLMTKWRSWFNKWSITVLIIGRFWFVCTFLIQATSTDVQVIDTVWFGFVNVALFALANGFATSALFIMAPEQVNGEIEKEIVGFLSVLGLTTGIMLGAYLALPFASIVPPASP